MSVIESFDWKRARRETPACENVIHFNNAGASLMPLPVVKELIDYTNLEAEKGGYEAAELSAEKIENFYLSAAHLLNCKKTEIAFVESATRGWDMAFYSIPFKSGDVILTGMSEYESNYLAFLQVSRKTGARIEVIPNDEYGQISIQELKNRIRREVKLIAITHVPTNGGLVNPAEKIGAIANEAGILFLLDSCQAAGQLSLDVQKLKCDFLSFTGRKYVRGPRGCGVLFVKDSVSQSFEPPFLDLQSAEWTDSNQFKVVPGATRFEQWEKNYGVKIALGTAMAYASSWGVGHIQKRISFLAAEFRKKLSSLHGVEVLDLGSEKCGIVSFRVLGQDPQNIREFLKANKINISVSQRRYTKLDMDSRNLDAVCRASLHYFNTEEEIDFFTQCLSRFRRS